MRTYTVDFGVSILIHFDTDYKNGIPKSHRIRLAFSVIIVYQLCEFFASPGANSFSRENNHVCLQPFSYLSGYKNGIPKSHQISCFSHDIKVTP